MLNTLDLSGYWYRLITYRERGKKMAVSKKFLAELVSELAIDKAKREAEIAIMEAEIAEQIAKGEICADCFMEYCECY